MPDRRGAAAALVITVTIASALAALLQLEGRRARRVRPGYLVVEVRDGAGALAAWRASGVRGRAILWLARELPIEPVGERTVAAFLRDPTAAVPDIEQSFLYLAMRTNLIRRVIYLVPDDRWDAYSAAARARGGLLAHGSGFIQFVEGVPVTVLAARDRGEALGAEPPLVHRDASTRQLFGEPVAAALEAEAARADVVTERL